MRFLLGAGLALGFSLTGGIADAAQARSGTIRVAVMSATLPARVDAVARDERAGQATVAASTRTNQSIGDQAVPIAVVGRDQLEAAMLRSPGDIVTAFNGMPGVRVQTTSPVLGTTTVRIHGLPGRYTRLLLDGVHLYGDRPGGYALLRIPPMDLERIEVIKGPASAFYGSDSPAGAVNLISRKPGAEPSRELLFNQSTRGATDGMLWLSSAATGPSRTWSHTFLVNAHRQEEQDVDDDGWSDIPGYTRGAFRQRVFWDNRQGKSISGVAGVTIEKRKGGSAFAREELETRTADGGLSGQKVLDSGYILAGAGALFVQSRTRDFSDGREGNRHQTATIEITLRRPGTKHTWLAGMASDWYSLRSAQVLPTTYVSTRPGIFVHDDFKVASWLLVSGSARVDHHNLYGFLLSPRGSALLRGGPWAARFSAAQGYFTPRPLTEETEAGGLARLSIDGPLDVEAARSVSADFSHTTGATALTLSVFRSHIDDPAQVDRATYTLRTGPEPIVTRGVEVLGTARQAPLAVTAAYTYVHAREGGNRDVALTPRHSASLVAAAEARGRGRIGVEVSFTGAQRLDANPYRTTSEPYVVLGLLAEHRIGRARLFVNAENLTDVRQTQWDPIARPARDVDGRWTVDAWAPLRGRVINAGVRILF